MKGIYLGKPGEPWKEYDASLLRVIDDIYHDYWPDSLDEDFICDEFFKRYPYKKRKQWADKNGYTKRNQPVRYIEGITNRIKTLLSEKPIYCEPIAIENNIILVRAWIEKDKVENDISIKRRFNKAYAELYNEEIDNEHITSSIAWIPQHTRKGDGGVFVFPTILSRIDYARYFWDIFTNWPAGGKKFYKINKDFKIKSDFRSKISMKDNSSLYIYTISIFFDLLIAKAVADINIEANKGERVAKPECCKTLFDKYKLFKEAFGYSCPPKLEAKFKRLLLSKDTDIVAVETADCINELNETLRKIENNYILLPKYLIIAWEAFELYTYSILSRRYTVKYQNKEKVRYKQQEYIVRPDHVIDEKKWILDAKYKMGYADPMQIELSDATRMMYYLLAKKEYLGIILFPSYNGIISSDELEERVSKSIQIIKPSISNKEPLVIKIGVALPLKKAQ